MWGSKTKAAEFTDSLTRVRKWFLEHPQHIQPIPAEDITFIHEYLMEKKEDMRKAHLLSSLIKANPGVLHRMAKTGKTAVIAFEEAIKGDPRFKNHGKSND